MPIDNSTVRCGWAYNGACLSGGRQSVESQSSLHASSRTWDSCVVFCLFRRPKGRFWPCFPSLLATTHGKSKVQGWRWRRRRFRRLLRLGCGAPSTSSTSGGAVDLHPASSSSHLDGPLGVGGWGVGDDVTGLAACTAYAACDEQTRHSCAQTRTKEGGPSTDTHSHIFTATIPTHPLHPPAWLTSRSSRSSTCPVFHGENKTPWAVPRLAWPPELHSPDPRQENTAVPLLRSRLHVDTVWFSLSNAFHPLPLADPTQPRVGDLALRRCYFLSRPQAFPFHVFPSHVPLSFLYLVMAILQFIFFFFAFSLDQEIIERP